MRMHGYLFSWSQTQGPAQQDTARASTRKWGTGIQCFFCARLTEFYPVQRDCGLVPPGLGRTRHPAGMPGDNGWKGSLRTDSFSALRMLDILRRVYRYACGNTVSTGGCGGICAWSRLAVECGLQILIFKQGV